MKHRHGKTTGVRSELPDLSEVPLDEVEHDLASGRLQARTIERVIPPRDGTRLPVAASFNSAV